MLGTFILVLSERRMCVALLSALARSGRMVELGYFKMPKTKFKKS